MENEFHEYGSQLDNLKEEVNHLKRAKYRETYAMEPNGEVTDEMLLATDEAQLFPMASQFADKDAAEEDDKETLQESCTSPLDDLANLPASLFQVEEPAVNPTSGEQATQVVE